jgi:3-dehydroquinate dehydratase/shikimate dehydrogenase
VQPTSAGMEPNTEIDPLPRYQFNGSEIVYELIYAPERTRFLRRAADAGCRTIGGREMLHAQALLQFEQFSSAYNPGAE